MRAREEIEEKIRALEGELLSWDTLSEEDQLGYAKSAVEHSKGIENARTLTVSEAAGYLKELDGLFELHISILKWTLDEEFDGEVIKHLKANILN